MLVTFDAETTDPTLYHQAGPDTAEPGSYRATTPIDTDQRDGASARSTQASSVFPPEQDALVLGIHRVLESPQQGDSRPPNPGSSYQGTPHARPGSASHRQLATRLDSSSPGPGTHSRPYTLTSPLRSTLSSRELEHLRFYIARVAPLVCFLSSSARVSVPRLTLI